MNFHNNNVAKYAIFFLGIVIIIFAPFLLGIKNIEMWKIFFADAIVLSAYTMFFYPTLPVFHDKHKTGGIFVAGGIYYKGVYVYMLISALILFAVFGANLKRSIAILLQLIAIFVFLIYIYLANASLDHIESVKKHEENKTVVKQQLKSKIQSLKIDIEDIESAEAKALIEEINEDLRYLSPTNNIDGQRLEETILGLVEDISNRNALNDEQYITYLKEIKKQIQKRKNIM